MRKQYPWKMHAETALIMVKVETSKCGRMPTNPWRHNDYCTLPAHRDSIKINHGVLSKFSSCLLAQADEERERAKFTLTPVASYQRSTRMTSYRRSRQEVARVGENTHRCTSKSKQKTLMKAIISTIIAGTLASADYTNWLTKKQ